jgi:peptide subunit release factor 1 (eRF1)
MAEQVSVAQEQLRAYEFRRALEEISKIKGRGTELISVYVPPGRQISDVMARLRNEYAESSNIKSRVTKNHVLWAIESAMNKLKQYRQVPENGIIIFTGMVSAGPRARRPSTPTAAIRPSTSSRCRTCSSTRTSTAC